LDHLERSNQVTLGSWISIGHPAVAELMASIGFDWLAVDLEHGAVDMSQWLSLVQAIKGLNVVPMARLPYKEPVWVRRALDIGFKGIIVPMVNNAQEASVMVRVAKYPPQGERGIGYAPANMYGTRFYESVASANEETTLICQIESKEAVDNLESILAVDGVDGVFLGPYDLSGSYGILGQMDHPLMNAAYDKLIETCERTDKLAGIHVVPPDPDAVAVKLKQGFNFIALSLDITFISTAAKTMLEKSRAAVERNQQGECQ
jgi:2-keto-3-deoxy-L-rhamnonate aldolase RhmA